MKKVLILITIMAVSFLSFGQTSDIPSSVSVFGQAAASDYLQLTNKTSSFEAEIFTSNTTFTDLNSLITSSANNWANSGGVSDEITLNSIQQSMSDLINSGGNYVTMISTAKISQQLKDIFQAIISQTQKIQGENDLNNILLPYSTKIEGLKLTVSEKEKLKSFIIAYNANFNVIVKSKILENKIKLSGTEAGRKWWQVVLNVVQCGLGTIGGALVGAVGGAGAGTITLPFVGTVSGAVVGFWGGAMAGASASCF